MREDKLSSQKSTTMFAGLLIMVLEANHIAIKEIRTRVNLSLGIVGNILKYVLAGDDLAGNWSFEQISLRDASGRTQFWSTIIVDVVVHSISVIDLYTTLQRHVV